MDVVYKDIAAPRLTIAADRITLKIPNVAKVPNESSLVFLAYSIVTEIGAVSNTLRGVFEQKESGRWSIAMHSGSVNGVGRSTKKHFKRFTEKP